MDNFKRVDELKEQLDERRWSDTMDDIEVILGMMCLVGVTLFVIGIFYGKKTHERFGDNDFLYYASNSFLWTPIFFVLSLFLGFGPWWLTKSLYLFIGFFMAISSLVILLD